MPLYYCSYLLAREKILCAKGNQSWTLTYLSNIGRKLSDELLAGKTIWVYVGLPWGQEYGIVSVIRWQQMYPVLDTGKVQILNEYNEVLLGPDMWVTSRPRRSEVNVLGTVDSYRRFVRTVGNQPR